MADEQTAATTPRDRLWGAISTWADRSTTAPLEPRKAAVDAVLDALEAELRHLRAQRDDLQARNTELVEKNRRLRSGPPAPARPTGGEATTDAGARALEAVKEYGLACRKGEHAMGEWLAVELAIHALASPSGGAARAPETTMAERDVLDALRRYVAAIDDPDAAFPAISAAWAQGPRRPRPPRLSAEGRARAMSAKVRNRPRRPQGEPAVGIPPHQVPWLLEKAREQLAHVCLLGPSADIDKWRRIVESLEAVAPAPETKKEPTR